MRLIDADAFKKQVAAMAIKENYSAEKANALMKLQIPAHLTTHSAKS